MTSYMEQQVKCERGEGASLKIDIWGKKVVPELMNHTSTYLLCLQN